MIIELLLNVVYALLSILTLPITFPQIPDKVLEIIATSLDYITTGIAIVSVYIDIEYLLLLFGIVFAFDIAIQSYHVVMWIIKKIPILNIK